MSQYNALMADDQSINGNASAAVPLAPVAVAPVAGFSLTIGEIPWCTPNVRPVCAAEDLRRFINNPSTESTIMKTVASALCGLTGVGCCYLLGKQVLVKEGQYGFAMNNGQPEILLPGRHLLSSPLNHAVHKASSGDDRIEVGPISIIRVRQGCYGFAVNDGLPEVLLPGLHVRKSAAFQFQDSYSLDNSLVAVGPIKMFIVKSGTVRIAYQEGKVQIFNEGRYLVNSGTFEVAGTIATVQQNVRFERHPVLLDGGISMMVEGLLTFQVVDVEVLVTQLGERDLLHTIKDVTKAELARVFASIHLEQISSAQNAQVEGKADEEDNSLLGKAKSGATTRTLICDEVLSAVTPLARSWGVQVVNFQLESTKIADQNYAMEYEEASLGLAKAKANRRAVDAQNEILLQKAVATSKALRIEAEGQKAALVIAAQGEAEARRIEAEARNDAAKCMTDEFAKQLQLQQQQVEFAKNLRATSVTVLPDSAVGRPLVRALGGV